MALAGLQSLRQEIQEEPEGPISSAPDQLYPNRLANLQTRHQQKVRPESHVCQLPLRTQRPAALGTDEPASDHLRVRGKRSMI